MNYRRNEDKLAPWPDRPLYNAVLPGGTQSEITPVTEPVTVDEVKEELQIDFTDHDVYLGKLITRMRRAMERYCGISMVPKNIVAYLKNEIGNIELPHGPVIVAGVVLNDIEGNVIAADSYDIRSEGVGLYLETMYDYVKASYVAGYGGDDGPDMPDDMKDALIRIVAHVFTHRADEGKATTEAIALFAHPFKRGTWLL